MKKVAVLLANGFEEIEALTVVDLLRRAEIIVDMVSVTGNTEVIGAHNIKVASDLLFENLQKNEYQMLVTPGGMPGSETLAKHKGVLELIRDFAQNYDRYVASICASPMVLEAAGVAKDYEGTIYPGMENYAQFKTLSKKMVVRDRNVITSRGPATAMAFALTLVEVLAGKEKRNEVAEDLLWSQLQNDIDKY